MTWEEKYTMEQEEAAAKKARLDAIRVYDSAIPQDWADGVRRETGVYPPGHIVWSYDGAGFMGQPVAIDDIGDQIMSQLGQDWNQPRYWNR